MTFISPTILGGVVSANVDINAEVFPLIFVYREPKRNVEGSGNGGSGKLQVSDQPGLIGVSVINMIA